MSGGIGASSKSGGKTHMGVQEGKVDSSKKQHQAQFKYAETYDKWINDPTSVERQDIIEALKFFSRSQNSANRAVALKHLRELKKEEEIENSKESLKDHDIS